MLTKSENEELVYLAYYERYARGSAQLSPIEQYRLNQLRRPFPGPLPDPGSKVTCSKGPVFFKGLVPAEKEEK